MEKSIRKDDMLHALIDAKADWVLAPNAFPSGSPKASAARHHGDFDSDWATLEATLGRMTGSKDGRLFAVYPSPRTAKLAKSIAGHGRFRARVACSGGTLIPSSRLKRRQTDLTF